MVAVIPEFSKCQRCIFITQTHASLNYRCNKYSNTFVTKDCRY